MTKLSIARSRSSASSPAAKATTLIEHYNEVWRTLIVPDNPVQVKSVDTIVYDWQSH